MDEALVRRDDTLALLSGAGLGLALPYSREILLLECEVAGTTHVDLRDLEPGLDVGALLTCRREPHNPHDPLAIRLDEGQGRKLGYIPRRKNEVLARLLDAGKTLVARLEAKEWQRDWLRLQVSVLLVD